MNKIGCWNIRGINGLQKQKYVRDWIKNNKLSLFSLIETKVQFARLDTLQNDLDLRDWRFISNATGHDKARIIIGWDPAIFDVHCLHFTEQWMTCRVLGIHQKIDIIVTMVYGHNTPAARQAIWDYLRMQGGNFSSQPWLLMGDFNATQKVTDSKGGDTNWCSHKQEFGVCMQQAELHIVPYRGIKFTWHNGQARENMIMKKLGWVIGNTTFAKDWPDAYAHFLPRDVSDHSSMVIHLSEDHFHPRPRFGFLNLRLDRGGLYAAA
ncbi:hypothetical protein OIU84_022340 [Salix udensis]|uniref:Endonuclease/exonuclease/phosphatase domain-containing protein n=1 Tax=Salix udensis TaxID=889485 RepID=A0AAD6KNE2_9ROSI|nr:hypothetical protein OIU84_022340 [Salix udensis]